MATVSDLAASVFEKAPQLRELYDRYKVALDAWLATGHVTIDDIRGKRVLDWECGAGIHSLLFLEHGAAQVDGIDSWLWTEEIERSMGHIEHARFHKISIEDFAKDPATHGAYDFVFANTVTEHMLQLPRVLTVVGTMLKPGGLFLTNHDNYYQPVGSHDHGLLFYGPGGKIVRQGPACWESPEKCGASAAYRADLMKRLPWTWDARTESKLTPQDCTKCPYHKRSQPWAHLRHQAEFRDVFPQPCFTTGYPLSSLNKATLFQVRQFVIEAGFDVVGWVTNRILNEPPAELMAPPFNFSRDDLTTCTVTVTARKASTPYTQ